MSSTLSDLYNELQQFSHLQQLHSVLSKDLRATRDRVLKETRSVRHELTFFRWCMRRDVNEEYPFPNSSTSSTSYITKGLDYDRLLFYRKLICYLHSHPIEFSKIIVSLPTIKNKPEINSLQSLYFDKEIHLAECIAFDIMLTDINSLTLLLRNILLHSKNFNTLSQKLFQLFIVITCHKLLNTTFRFLLNRLYTINEPLSFQKLSGIRSEILSSTLYKSCDDVLSVIISVLRILPIPLRYCISIMRSRVNNNESELLEWLLSTIFSPLLLQPDDWYLVICNPSVDDITNTANIQYIVTTLLQLCRTYKEGQQVEEQDEKEEEEDTVEITQLLLNKHGVTLTLLLRNILDSCSDDSTSYQPSEVLIPSNATPELFIWHKIFLKIDNLKEEYFDLYNLVISILPPKNIPYRPWITIQLPTIDFNKNNDITNDDFTKQPKSKYLSQYIFKPIRVFLLSLSKAQSISIESIDKYDININNLGLNTQQITLLYEARSRMIENNILNINDILNKIVLEYKNIFCNNLQEALSTHNVLSSLNYIQNKETILSELRIIFIETHENLQMRDILYLSKKNINILRLQLEKIMIQINSININNISGGTGDGNNNINGINDGSDWMNDKFVTQKTNKCISKTRNALIRFLNDYGIGKVDFKGKFGGSILDFTNKRISSILINAIIIEIKDIFWSKCPIEDGKFKYQIIELNNKYKTLSEFMIGFVGGNNKNIKLPNLSIKTVSMMINKLSEINIENKCQTIGNFEECISTVREGLIASINGADSADGDDYMTLFCYILMKSNPHYLPSQLQTTKIISQRKTQDKYFIDCCVAMKALRNFCNVLFKNENKNNTQIGIITQTNTQTQPIINDNTQINNNNKKTTPQSLFNSLRAKLPQRTTKSASPAAPQVDNNNNNNNNKKAFFNISPTSSLSSFINKTKNISASDNDSNDNNNNKQENEQNKIEEKQQQDENEEEEEEEESNENQENDNSNKNNNNNNNDSDVMVQVTTSI